MNLLLHICCGPCSLYPLTVLREKGITTRGYFFNPNIHPFREYERRVKALETVAEKFSLPMIWDKRGYDLEHWFQAINDSRDHTRRCPVCYRVRLEAAARVAAETGMEAFTTTLLYSRYQRHDVIRKTGIEAASRHGVKFWYHDFREGWQQGIDMSIEAEIYRQPYCGCIFSERERYEKREKRLASALNQENGHS